MKARLYTALLLVAVAAVLATGLDAKPAKRAGKSGARFVPGRELTLIGQLMATPERYARVDTTRYGGFTDFQRTLNREASGLALVFTTNSSRVLVNFDYVNRLHGFNDNDVASAGADLYIRRDGRWVYAGSGVPTAEGKPATLAAHMAPGEKECLLYLPLRSIVSEVYVGIDKKATIAAAPNPFSRTVVVWGSSYTQGVSANRPGQAYPLQLQRATGLDIRSLGVSGNSKLQQSYARVLADADAEAFLLDAFSNPSAAEIAERFDDFLATVRAAHPGVPIVFMQTIRRGGRNFDTHNEREEAAKEAAAVEAVARAMASDPDVYMLFPVADTDGFTSTDRIHPSDLGYFRWMESIRQPLLDILARYGITPPISH